MSCYNARYEFCTRTNCTHDKLYGLAGLGYAMNDADMSHDHNHSASGCRRFECIEACKRSCGPRAGLLHYCSCPNSLNNGRACGKNAYL